jgi:xanthine dehydrogenase YagS FAD-binding subunit
MRSFRYIDAHSVEEAVSALARFGGKARLSAGGTDLLGLLKDECLPTYPEVVVNVKNVPGLDSVWEEGGMLKIGALARLSELGSSRLLRERYPALAEAAYAVASPQIRNVATLGGNLCQDVRCAYYRYPSQVGGAVDCARKHNGPCLAPKGDNRNHAIMGGRRCFAVCPSDTAVALAALDASLVVAGSHGEHSIPVSEFYTPLAHRLKNGEMVTRIEIPAMSLPQQRFIKFALRRSIDFAIVSVAVAASVSDGICNDVRIALGAVAPGPVRATAAEEFLRGKPINEETAAEAASLALAGAKPLSKNGYKIDIATALVKRGLLGEAGDGAMKKSM